MNEAPPAQAMDLNTILKIALKGGASDIHLKAGLPAMFRTRGSLVPLEKRETDDTG